MHSHRAQGAREGEDELWLRGGGSLGESSGSRGGGLCRPSWPAPECSQLQVLSLSVSHFTTRTRKLDVRRRVMRPPRAAERRLSRASAILFQVDRGRLGVRTDYSSRTCEILVVVFSLIELNCTFGCFHVLASCFLDLVVANGVCMSGLIVIPRRST